MLTKDDVVSMIKENIQKILSELPQGVELVAATKTRSIEDLIEAADAGVKIFGENYVQEAQIKQSALGNIAQWHLIGHLQTNKVKTAVQIFDCIETVDSEKLARAIDKECAKANKVMPVFIEVNVGSEESKDGIALEKAFALAGSIAALRHLRLDGVMTMGSFDATPDIWRAQFTAVKAVFDQIKSAYPQCRFLSMGMSSSYRIAIKEGANMVRLGTVIFGVRQ